MTTNDASTPPARRPRIAFVVATDMTARAFLGGHFRALAKKYDLSLIAHTDDPDVLAGLGVNGRTFPVAIERAVSPSRDLRALATLVRLFRRERFDAVHSVTPKAGLLAMTAARIVGVPHRTHTFTGQVWATRTGGARAALRALDRWTHHQTTFSIVDSPSQRDFLVAEGVLRPGASGVLGDGSVSGVDTARYRPDTGARRSVRAEWGVGEDDVLFLQLGRLTRDKGVLDLCAAFVRVHAATPGVRLAFVGPDEGMAAQMRVELAPVGHAACVVEGFTAAPERFVAAADVLCLPSYREGFGTVVLEAAATGVPALASRIYGVTDAVVDGVTGLLHTPSDADEIARAMTVLATDAGLRARLGAAARVRACEAFSEARLTSAMVAFYAERLGPGGPRP